MVFCVHAPRSRSVSKTEARDRRVPAPGTSGGRLPENESRQNRSPGEGKLWSVSLFFSPKIVLNGTDTITASPSFSIGEVKRKWGKTGKFFPASEDRLSRRNGAVLRQPEYRIRFRLCARRVCLRNWRFPTARRTAKSWDSGIEAVWRKAFRFSRNRF